MASSSLPSADCSKSGDVFSSERKRGDDRGEEALKYVKKASEIFKGKPGMYDDFINIIGDFSADGYQRRMDDKEFVSEIGRLFSGHPELIFGLEPFLPSRLFKLMINCRS